MKICASFNIYISKTILISLLFFTINLNAQESKKSNITYSAYAEVYYSTNLDNKSIDAEKQNFVYNHKKLNQPSANLVFGKINYSTTKVRGKIALMVGDYATNNLSSEPKWAQYILEANAGVKLSNKENIWLDIGIMPSHIGFESAISADCWALTRSMVAENSPYYETGAKLSFIDKKDKLTVAFLVLNGWQKIVVPNNIKKPAYGLQFNYKATSNLSFNYSNFIGNNSASNIFPTRSYHNFYIVYNDDSKYGLIIGLDIGTDKKNAVDYGKWVAPVIILKKKLNSTINWACRAEYFKDKNQIIVPTNAKNGFQNFGLSTNLDVQINKYLIWRSEIKRFTAKDAIFNNSKSNLNFTTNFTFKL